MNTNLIFGCGYLGLRVARRWRVAGDVVYTVTRSNSRAAAFVADGLIPIVADVVRPDSLAALPLAHTVLYAVGYDRSAGPSMREVYVEGLRHVLDAVPDSVERIIYISSTSVYAQTSGEWVDEESPCLPTRENGRVCLEAEELLQSHRCGSRAIVLRLAGIYGPGRIPRRDALVAGEPIPAPSQGCLNLIHVDDAATVVLAAEARARPPRLYTVSDGHPPQRREYYEELARLLDAPPPRFIDPPADSPAALRAESDKRISNRRMMSELDVVLRYPSFREGLAAIVTD